ncbi:hypothetical protein Salat_2555900 [Sesamum alatum]|uniref:Uncharacterized protein n=1 Tax=Sesamum alatum TaxID=300844 RepID=A0AAE2CCN7_9LAMI|nr:hypothetical protein Salat_2555900 [Sesamum alatum]
MGEKSFNPNPYTSSNHSQPLELRHTQITVIDSHSYHCDRRLDTAERDHFWTTTSSPRKLHRPSAPVVQLASTSLSAITFRHTTSSPRKLHLPSTRLSSLSRSAIPSLLFRSTTAPPPPPDLIPVRTSHASAVHLCAASAQRCVQTPPQIDGGDLSTMELQQR